MAQERERKLREAGWISVKDELPPLGEEVEVCQADEYTQGIWGQIFKSRKEIQASGITHWSYYKKYEKKQ